MCARPVYRWRLRLLAPDRVLLGVPRPFLRRVEGGAPPLVLGVSVVGCPPSGPVLSPSFLRLAAWRTGVCRLDLTPKFCLMMNGVCWAISSWGSALFGPGLCWVGGAFPGGPFGWGDPVLSSCPAGGGAGGARRLASGVLVGLFWGRVARSSSGPLGGVSPARAVGARRVVGGAPPRSEFVGGFGLVPPEGWLCRRCFGEPWGVCFGREGGRPLPGGGSVALQVNYRILNRP